MVCTPPQPAPGHAPLCFPPVPSCMAFLRQRGSRQKRDLAGTWSSTHLICGVVHYPNQLTNSMLWPKSLLPAPLYSAPGPASAPPPPPAPPNIYVPEPAAAKSSQPPEGVLHAPLASTTQPHSHWHAEVLPATTHLPQSPQYMLQCRCMGAGGFKQGRAARS